MTTIKDIIRDFGYDMIRQGVDNCDNFNSNDNEYLEEQLTNLMEDIKKAINYQFE